IRRVGLEQQPIERHVRERIAQIGAAPLVANPTRDADVKTEIEIRLELGASAREAMRDAARETRPPRLEQRDEIVVRVALMQEHGLADARRELELRFERRALRITRREIAKVVEPAFADG